MHHHFRFVIECKIHNIKFMSNGSSAPPFHICISVDYSQTKVSTVNGGKNAILSSEVSGELVRSHL